MGEQSQQPVNEDDILYQSRETLPLFGDALTQEEGQRVLPLLISSQLSSSCHS